MTRNPLRAAGAGCGQRAISPLGFWVHMQLTN